MEKPGIRPGSLVRHGPLTGVARLCVVLAVLFFALTVCPALEADVSIVPDEVETGRPFLMRILAYPSEPADTSLEIEGLPGTFAPGASSKEKRMTEQSWAVGSERMAATLFSREWTPTEPGDFSIGPLVLRSGKEELRLPPVQVRVVRPPDEGVARLFWSLSGNGPDGSGGTGEFAKTGPVSGTRVRLSLNAQFNGSLISVRCPAPEGGLLETVATGKAGLSSRGTETVQVGVYDWTPLGNGSRRLPDAVLEYATIDGAESRLSSEPRSVLVRDGKKTGYSAEGVRAKTAPMALAAAFSDAPLSPSSSPSVTGTGSIAVPPSLDGAGEDTVLLEAKRYWLEGKRGSALARLRAAEYADYVPMRYRAARLEAEKALGLDDAPPVPAAAWKHPSVFGSIFLFLAALSTVFFRRVYRGPAAGLFLLSVALAAFSVYVYVEDSKPAAVVVGGDLFHVPDASSRVVETLPEGSVVGVHRSADGWAYVRTERSLFGWMKVNQFILYTRGDAKR